MGYIEDKNGCFHAPHNGRFVSKFYNEVLLLLCKSFKIDHNGANADEELERALIYRAETEAESQKKRDIEIKFNIPPEENSVVHLSTSISVKVKPGHWKRLNSLVAERHYHGSGTGYKSGPYEVYNIDNILCFIQGNYSNFVVCKTKRFNNPVRLEECLREMRKK